MVTGATEVFHFLLHRLMRKGWTELALRKRSESQVSKVGTPEPGNQFVFLRLLSDL